MARPKSKPKPVKRTDAVQRADGWANVLTGLGGDRDKRSGMIFSRETLKRSSLTDLWRSDAMAARVIEKKPSDMIRKGFRLVIEDDPDRALSELSEARLDELDIYAVLFEALCFERAFGGAAIFIGAVDAAGDNLAAPLDYETIQSVQFLAVFGPDELKPSKYSDELAAKAENEADPEAAPYGEAALWTLKTKGAGGKDVEIDIHESRLIRFTGISTGRDIIRASGGWGDSVLQRCYRAIIDYQSSYSAAAALIPDFAQGVYRLAGLAELVAANEKDLVLNRITQMDVARSVLRSVVLDKEDDFSRQSTPVGGLPELLDRFANNLAAAAQIPVTLLMGQAPAGLNATGASDIRSYYDEVASDQRHRLRPRLNRIVRAILCASDGPTSGKEPENWTVEFNPLWELTDLEAADLRLKQAQADQVYVTIGAVTPEEIAVSRFGGDGYSTETKLDVESRDAMNPENIDPALPAPTVDPAAPDAPPSDPADPASTDESVDPSTALNGAQVTALLEIVTAVAERKIPRSTGVMMINAAFPLSVPQAEKIMGETGASFVAEVAAPVAPAPRVPTAPVPPTPGE